MSKWKNRQQGFTLLEVIVALTITGLVLGAVMGLSAGSKRLAFRAQHSVEQTLVLRATLNISQLQAKPEYPELPEAVVKSIKMQPQDYLERPERQTQRITAVLEPYQLKQKGGKSAILESVRWKLLDSVPADI